jgi:hypothetical protein
MAGQVDFAVLEKENITATGLTTTAAKRSAEGDAGKGEQVKKRATGLRPSTRVMNIPTAAKDAEKAPKPAIMGPPPPRIPAKLEDGAVSGPAKAVQVDSPENR